MSGMSGGNQPAANRPRHNPASNDGPASTLSELPPDALRIVFVYAVPESRLHRLEFIGSISAVCRSFRELVSRMWLWWRLDLAMYGEYIPLAGPNREPRDCRLAVLQSLAKYSLQRKNVRCIKISRLSLEKEPGTIVDGHFHPGRICNTILKALRALLAMNRAFPNAKSIFIELSLHSGIRRNDTNVPLINKNVLKKMSSAFPRLTQIRFGHCLDPDTLLEGNLLKFFQELKQPLTYLSLLNIHLLDEIHVAIILKCIGSGLNQLEIFGGGGINGEHMFTGNEEEHNMYAALSTHCQQLQKLTLAKLRIRDISSNLGKILDLDESLTELTVESNNYYSIDGDFETYAIDTEALVAGLFKNKGKNLERFKCNSFRWKENAGAALRNLVALQKREATTSTGADGDGDNGNGNDGITYEGAPQKTYEGAPQKKIKLHTAFVGQCPIEDICAAVSDGVRTIGLPEWTKSSYLGKVRSHFHETGVSIPSGATIMIGKREYDLCTGELK